MSEETFLIEAEGKTYRQKYLSSEAGLRLQLKVVKVGLMPALQAAATLVGESDVKTALQKLAGDSGLQGQLLASAYDAVQAVELGDIKLLQELLWPVTTLEDGQAGITLDLLPNHFASITDNARLFSLLAQSIKVQLAPLFHAQFISRLSAPSKA